MLNSVYYITRNGSKELVAHIDFNGCGFSVYPTFEGMQIDEDTESITIDGEEYEIESESDSATGYNGDFSDEELAFIIRNEGAHNEDTEGELVRRAGIIDSELWEAWEHLGEEEDEDDEKEVNKYKDLDFEELIEKAAEVLGVEI